MPHTSDIELGEAPCETPPRKETLVADEVFGQRLADVGFPDVFYHPKRNMQESIINLGNLQRMMLHFLQRELVQEVTAIQETASVSGGQATRIRSALSAYSKPLFSQSQMRFRLRIK